MHEVVAGLEAKRPAAAKSAADGAETEASTDLQESHVLSGFGVDHAFAFGTLLGRASPLSSKNADFLVEDLARVKLCFFDSSLQVFEALLRL